MVGFICAVRQEALLVKRVYRYPSKPGVVALDEISKMRRAVKRSTLITADRFWALLSSRFDLLIAIVFSSIISHPW